MYSLLHLALCSVVERAGSDLFPAITGRLAISVSLALNDSSLQFSSYAGCLSVGRRVGFGQRKAKVKFVAIYSRLRKLIEETITPAYIEYIYTVFENCWNHLDIYGVLVTSSASQNTLFYAG